MKFESDIGLGEVCIYNENARRGEKTMTDTLVKVVQINFMVGGNAEYVVEHISDKFGLQRFVTVRAQLTPDPDFNHEYGCYLPSDSIIENKDGTQTETQ